MNLSGSLLQIVRARQKNLERFWPSCSVETFLPINLVAQFFLLRKESIFGSPPDQFRLIFNPQFPFIVTENARSPAKLRKVDAQPSEEDILIDQPSGPIFLFDLNRSQSDNFASRSRHSSPQTCIKQGKRTTLKPDASDFSKTVF